MHVAGAVGPILLELWEIKTVPLLFHFNQQTVICFPFLSCLSPEIEIVLLFAQTLCIWGAGGATPGKFLLGLRVVSCDTSTLVRPNRVLVVPASNVSLSA